MPSKSLIRIEGITKIRLIFWTKSTSDFWRRKYYFKERKIKKPKDMEQEKGGKDKISQGTEWRQRESEKEKERDRVTTMERREGVTIDKFRDRIKPSHMCLNGTERVLTTLSTWLKEILTGTVINVTEKWKIHIRN